MELIHKNNPKRSWDILLVGGSSGSGKSAISQCISKLYNVNIVEVDDFQTLLEAMTSPKTLPSIHYWNTHPDWKNEDANTSIKHLIDVGKALIPGLNAVINDHIESNVPMILEGDFILPELAASFTNPRIKSIFIYEPEKEQILQNYLNREGTIQEYRSEESFLYGNWLKENCIKHKLNVINSRPWDDLLIRVLSVLN